MRSAVSRSSLLLIGLVGATLGFAPAPVFRERPDDPDAVFRRLQGTWAVSRNEEGGQTRIPMGQAFTIKFEKDQWTFLRSENGGPLIKSDRHTLKLDPKATPAEIDFIFSATKEVRFCGVYELKGDTLRIAFRSTANGTKGRAKDLSNPAPGDWFMQLERRP